jgi:hypothetical protein
MSGMEDGERQGEWSNQATGDQGWLSRIVQLPTSSDYAD